MLVIKLLDTDFLCIDVTDADACIEVLIDTFFYTLEEDIATIKDILAISDKFIVESTGLYPCNKPNKSKFYSSYDIKNIHNYFELQKDKHLIFYDFGMGEKYTVHYYQLEDSLIYDELNTKLRKIFIDKHLGDLLC